MQKKVLIFDLDGTLINTLKDLNIAVNYALKQFNLPLRSLEQTRKDIGNGVSKLMERSIDKDHQYIHQQALKIFKDYYKEHYFDNSFPYEGVLTTIKELKDKCYTLAVVSNKFNEGANRLVKHYFKDLFTIIQGEEEPLRKKPYPDMVNKVIKELRVDKKDCLYIGDTEIDYQTAINAGLDVVLVSYGYRDKKYLKEIKNASIIDALRELNNLLS